jgi:hypothetical protein
MIWLRFGLGVLALATAAAAWIVVLLLLRAQLG